MKRLWGSLGAVVAAVALISACGETVPATAVPPPMDEGDVVYSGAGPEGAKNIERFDAFIDVTESGGDDAVRIVTNTEEGDPIFTDVTFRQGAYEIYIDNSEDRYAGEGNRKRSKVAECGKLERTDEVDAMRRYACGEYAFYIRKV